MEGQGRTYLLVAVLPLSPARRCKSSTRPVSPTVHRPQHRAARRAQAAATRTGRRWTAATPKRRCRHRDHPRHEVYPRYQFHSRHRVQTQPRRPPLRVHSPRERRQGLLRTFLSLPVQRTNQRKQGSRELTVLFNLLSESPSLVSLWDLEWARILLGPRAGKEKPSGEALPGQ